MQCDHGPVGVPAGHREKPTLPVALGYLEKLGFSFKIKACEKFYHRHIVNFPRIKF
jgi:hypothetical protein